MVDCICYLNKEFVAHNGDQCKAESKLQSNGTIETHLNVTDEALIFCQNHKHIHSFTNFGLSLSYWSTVICNQMRDVVHIMDSNINRSITFLNNGLHMCYLMCLCNIVFSMTRYTKSMEKFMFPAN